MVSYPDRDPRNARLPFHSSSTQRTPSVASSSRASQSTVRRHRHGRSLHGGSGGGSSAVQNEFPVFGVTGDVEILLKSRDGRQERKYILHRLILSQCSGFFEDSMNEDRNRPDQESSARRQSTNAGDAQRSGRWRYELEYGRSEDDVPVLVRRPVSSSSDFGREPSPTSRPPPLRPKPAPPQNGFFRSMANFSALHVTSTAEDPTSELFRAYDNFFRIFYNYPPSLDNVNIANAYVESKGLLQLADMYDSLDIIGPRIDHHLLRFQSRLWKQIAKYPASYLKLGFLARSRDIFREALVHVVGQWPAGERQLRGAVPQRVLELIEDKADELEETKARVEAKLFRLTLTTTRGERVNPANDWLAWIVLSLWRQWFAEKTTPAPASILKDSSARASRDSSLAAPPRHAGLPASLNPHDRSVPPQPTAPPLNTGRVFRQVGAGGQAYLDHADLKRFLRQAGPDVYTRDNLRRAERRLDELKNLAAAAVQPLMRNFLELDVREAGISYLTCSRLEERDWPWEED